MRRSAVCALAMAHKVHLARLCHDRTRTGRNHTLGNIRHHMHAVDHVNMRILQRAFIDHSLRSANGLLRRLEQQHNIIHKLRSMVIQPCSKRKQIGHMAIVSAGMHITRMLGCIGTSSLFIHRQSINIRAERKYAALSVSTKHRTHARPRKSAQIIRRKHFKLLKQICLCFMFLIAHLRNPVQCTAMLPQAAQILRRFYFKTVEIHHLFRPLKTRIGAACSIWA